MLFASVILNAVVGSIDKSAVVGLDSRVVDEAVVVGIFIVVVSDASWPPHTILKFPLKPPVNI